MMAEAADSSMAIKVLVVKVPRPELHCSADLISQSTCPCAWCSRDYAVTPE